MQQQQAAAGFRAIDFPSEGETLRGRLYLPRIKEPVPAQLRLPLLIMGHGFTSTIPMTTDRYAEAFAARGLAVLLYDHRNFGVSGGEPRREVNPWIQARGYRDAVRFARSSLAEVDPERIALWGVSNSGMQVLVLGALLDGQIAAVTAVVPSCGEEPPPPDPDGRLFALLRETFEQGDVTGTPETTTGPLPVVSFDPIRYPAHLAPPTAFRWFVEHGGRPGSGWTNDATRVVPATMAPFRPGIAAPHVRVPVQVIYAPDDEMGRANPMVTRIVCEALGGPKEIVELEEGCGHFGELWYPSRWFDQVSALQADFLLRHLTAPAP
ncbi:MAG: alpha/beta hydrolase [Rhodospirillales bacterium]|nr:alpha/beta hydrolase [Rhodospirillales bacterium]MDB5382671.1 alpha/beta hydrolase [Rhodospirillales bacterium]